jgi:hypothetical protein
MLFFQQRLAKTAVKTVMMKAKGQQKRKKKKTMVVPQSHP